MFFAGKASRPAVFGYFAWGCFRYFAAGRVRSPLAAPPAFARPAIADGIFYAIRGEHLRCRIAFQRVVRTPTHLVFGTGAEGLFQFEARMMGPCARRNDSVGACAGPRPHQGAVHLAACAAKSGQRRREVAHAPIQLRAITFWWSDSDLNRHSGMCRWSATAGQRRRPGIHIPCGG